MDSRVIAVIASVALAAASVSVLAPGAAEASRPHTVTASAMFLNSWAPSAAVGDTKTYPLQLVSGQSYTIRVAGTFSAWKDWESKKCGSPEAAPVWGSPHRKNTLVGDDAVFRFASPLLKKYCPTNEIRPTGVFQFNLGNAWQSFVPDGGVPSSPANGNHVYEETVTGSGAEPKFRIVDWHPRDNDGELKIEIF